MGAWTVTTDELRALHREELLDLAALVGDLTSDEWARPSLCEGWSVHDVINHVVAWEGLIAYRSPAAHPLRLAGLALAFARSGCSIDRMNERTLLPSRSPGDLAAAVRRCAGRGRHVFDRMSPGTQLAELVVHQQDVRRPLGRPRSIPADRLRAALDGVGRLPGIDTGPVLDRHRLQATDVEWSAGAGRLVEAPGEALLMTLAGRPGIVPLAAP